MKCRFDYHLLFIILLIAPVIKAQYTPSDRALIKTTSIRQYDNEIIKRYLTSANEQQTTAALLAISNSGDTSWISNILNLSPVKDYRRDIVFCLSQLGPSTKSTEYLLQLLARSSSPYEIRGILSALGNTGDSAVLRNIIGMTFEGKALSILNFYSRGIKSPESEAIIVSEILSDDDSVSLAAMFAANRMGLSARLHATFVKIFNYEISAGRYNSEKTYYCLVSFRRAKKAPYSVSEAKVRNAKFNFNQRVEFARTLPFLREKDSLDEVYTDLLLDKNPNVAISAASSLADLKNNDGGVIKGLYPLLREIILEPSLNEDVRGNIFTGIISMFPDSSVILRKECKSKISKKYYLKSFGIAKLILPMEQQELLNLADDGSSTEKIEVITALASNRNEWKKIFDYDKELLNLISNDPEPAIISVFFESIDSAFIAENSAAVAKAIIDFFGANKDNYETSSAYPQLLKTLESISAADHGEAIRILKSSSKVSPESIAPLKPGIKAPELKSFEMFDKFIDRAFTYSSARILTTKGEIRFKLLPQYAPLTVGNFIWLTESGFYNGVKFHRVVPGFVIQSGDTSGTGWYGPGYQIISEFSYLPFTEGTAGIASNGPDTEGSQWFFMQKDFPHLNGRYTAWGQCSESIEVIRNITESDAVLRIVLEK
ncbi:MAG: peptidylprolyl isomerase [Ignavibacteriaceae bacterium]|nr:peptidylprolyl isomerase [Ignavibacteriaceae bacterium]